MGNLKKIANIAILTGLMIVTTIIALNALDRSIYPGCRVLDQQADVLIIELDDKFETATDTACQEFGELVYKIAQDGYQIQVYGGHFARLGVITKEKAKQLAEGY
jgi:hypothetical protein